MHGLLELLNALTFEVCKPHDFLPQSHAAVSLSIPLGFVHPFEALQTFFMHGAINSYLRKDLRNISASPTLKREKKLSAAMHRLFYKKNC